MDLGTKNEQCRSLKFYSVNIMKLKRKSENESLYYLLATVCGEQGKMNSFDGKYEAENRRIWNAIMGQWLDDDVKANFAKALDVHISEFDPLKDSELQKIDDRLNGSKFTMEDIPTKSDAHMFHVIEFKHVQFKKPLLMSKRLFPSNTTFSNCIFSFNTTFANSLFQSAHFLQCTFERNAYFRDAKFGNFGSISNACEFKNCHFMGHADFSRGQLRNADFTKSNFETSVHFEDTFFYLGCPKFFEAQLPENTILPLKDESWGLPFTRLNRAGNLDNFTEEEIHRESIKYAVLRKRMEEIQRPVDTNFLVRKELALRSQLKGWDSLLIKAYDIFSGYGNSIRKPLIWIFITIAFGVAAYSGYFLQLKDHEYQVSNSFFSGLGLSLAATFSFLSLGRLFFEDVLRELPAVLAVIYGFQAFLGFLFSFLLGLGVRSQLRLK